MQISQTQDEFTLPPVKIQWQNEYKDFYFEKQIAQYKVLSKLGQGKFGMVKAGEDILNHRQVAIKLINKSNLNDIERNSIKTEAEVMSYIKHRNVVDLYDVIENQNYICMVMEYAGGGELFDHIMRQTKLQEVEARRIFVQIVDGILHCHEKRIIHRDIKAENIFLDEKFELVKIGDWGFSSLFTPGKTIETACGSLDYASPEILCGKAHVGPEVDVWALGVLLYFMVCGWLPFRSATDFDVYQKIKKSEYRQLPSHITEDLKNLIEQIFNKDPKTRITTQQLKEHPWCLKARQDPDYLKRPKLPKLLQLQIRQHPRSLHTRTKSDSILVSPRKEIPPKEESKPIQPPTRVVSRHKRTKSSSDKEDHSKKRTKRRKKKEGEGEVKKKAKRSRRHKIYEEEVEQEEPPEEMPASPRPSPLTAIKSASPRPKIPIPILNVQDIQVHSPVKNSNTLKVTKELEIKIEKSEVERPFIKLSSSSPAKVPTPQTAMDSINTPPLKIKRSKSKNYSSPGSPMFRSRSRGGSLRKSNFSILKVADNDELDKIKDKGVEVLSVEKSEQGDMYVLVSARSDRGEENKVLELMKEFEKNSSKLKRSKSLQMVQSIFITPLKEGGELIPKSMTPEPSNKSRKRTYSSPHQVTKKKKRGYEPRHPG